MVSSNNANQNASSPSGPKKIAGISSPTRDPLYRGIFKLLPSVQRVHPRLFVSPAEIAAAEDHYRRDPDFFRPLLPKFNTLSTKSTVFPPENVDNVRKLAWLASAYRVTRDPAYLTLLKQCIPALKSFNAFEIPTIGTSNLDLNASDYLILFSLTYDVLKGIADPELEQSIRGALIREAQAAYRSLVSLPTFPYEQNHLTKPISGLGIAGMTLLDELAEAHDWAIYARNLMERADDTIAHDGWFFEGMSYWSYTLYSTVIFTTALKNTTGDDWFQKPLYKLGPLYAAHVILPNPNFVFDFGDCGPRVLTDGKSAQAGYNDPWHTVPVRIVNTVPYALQRGLNDPLSADVINRVSSLDPQSTNYLDAMFLLLWDVRTPAKSTLGNLAQPPYHYFDDMDVIHWRSSWNDPKATALAFKSGPPAGHHIASLLPLYPEWKPAMSHAHPDAGAFILFAQGAYLVGVTDYAVKETANCSSLLVDGAGQEKSGTPWSTFSKGPYSKYNKIHLEHVWLGRDVAAATAVIQDAYGDDLKLRSLRRDLIMVAGRYLVIRDQIDSELPHEYEWRLQVDREVRNSRANRFAVENGDGRLVIENLSPVASFKTEPTIVETELYIKTVSRPQQRGFHLAMKSPKATRFRFLTAMEVQTRGQSESSFKATEAANNRIELSDGTSSCTIWIGASDELQGTFAYILRDAQGAIQSTGVAGKSLTAESLRLTLPASANATVRPTSDGTWEAESTSKPFTDALELQAVGKPSQRVRVKAISTGIEANSAAQP
jgi:hypothetical protein